MKKRMTLIIAALLLLTNLFGGVFTTNDIVLAKTTNADKYVVTAGALNLRSKPSTKGKVIKVLKQGDAVTLISKQNTTWWKVNSSGKKGYISSKYLSSKLDESLTKDDIDAFKQMPQDAFLLVVNSYYNQIGVYNSGKLLKRYACATGKASTPTPNGFCKIVNKIKNRPYYKYGIPGGAPNNPLGPRWHGLSLNGTSGSTYGIHGTNNESSIGKNISHGCIRMHNADVKELFKYIPVGAKVIVTSKAQSDKKIASTYGIKIK